MKNPRRSYDAQGRELAPATVATEREAGVHMVEIWCGECHHHGEASTEGMAAETPIPDICLRYKCSACGSRNLTSRPSVMEHYRVLQQRTGMSHGNGPIPPRVTPVGGHTMPKVVITTVEEYEAATREVQELTGAPEGTPEERRLIDLVLAIEIWDASHDDATAWR